MSDQNLSNYPRSVSDVPDFDRLRSLVQGYFMLDWIYAVGAISNLIYLSLRESNLPLVFVITFVFLFAFYIIPVRKIAYGLGWDSERFWLFLVVATLASCSCCGILGPIVLRYQARETLDKYKFPGVWSTRRKLPCYYHVEKLKARYEESVSETESQTTS